MLTNELGFEVTEQRPKRRPYRLSTKGLQSLQAAVWRTQPWTKSTGPRSLEGKDRIRMNALKHGERSATTETIRKLARATVRELARGCLS
jgi:hypothetical protein